MPESCAAAECKQSTEQRDVSFFRFPLEPERCKQWVGNCRRPDLQNKSPEYLHRNFKLCSRHFEVSLIQKESDLKSVLKDGAVPTIFDFTTKKGNAQNRKRKIQAPAADPVETKKVKDEMSEMSVEQNVVEDPAESAVEQDPTPARPETEDPAMSKAKEVLKIHFKETLAFTGFSIVNNATIGTTKSMGGGGVGPLVVDPVCAENIDPKDVLRLGEEAMREEIRNSLRMARFFSILLQDKMNIEGKDQIPVFVRSVSSDGFPQKHLLGFLPCDVDSDSLYLMLMSEIRNKWGLRMEHCRGFTYLTTGTLCQKLKEFSCRMVRDFPQVVLAPSDPYAFNMWLIRSLPVLSVQDVVDTVEEVATVLRQSETLMKKLIAKITAAYCHIKGEVERVKESCQNYWEYSTDAFQTMLDILEPLLNSIGEMCTSALSEVDATVVEQLLKLKEKLKNFNFIITLVILKNTLCCVSILNPSLRGIISISSTLQYTISNALKLLNKHLQEIPIFHRKWFSDAVGRAKKLGVTVTLPVDTAPNGGSDTNAPTSPEDYYRETLSKMVLQYLIDEVKRVLGIEMVRILRWLSLVPSYMADHNFSIRKDKVADANLNNLARPDSFYDELGCWEVKWRHASKRRILPTGVFATLKIPDIGFYPNVQSLLRVLGSIPCINADADVYVQYDMVLDRYRSYMKVIPAEKRLCNMAFVYVNQDVHFNIDDMVQSYVESHPDILQLLCKDDVMDVQPSATENNTNDASKDDAEEPNEIVLDMELERPKPAECSGTDKEALKSALKAALTAACNSQSRQCPGGSEGEVEYVTKSEMNEVLKVCADVVQDGIISETGNSFFSLFIDRAVKFGETDFLPLFLRFVDSFDIMRLELMGFVEANLDTEEMCDRLFDLVTKEWRLDFKYCRGQAYLGSGEISYKLKAFACKVQEKYPLAICTHCSCYSFNTWWSRSVPVSSISRALDVLEKVVLFFSSSTELEKQLDQVIAVGLRESFEKIHEFQGNFCSSWQEKHDSYDVFCQILEPLVDCLERFHNSGLPIWSLSVINQAKKLLQLIRDFDFIVAIVALKNVSSFTRELSAALQKDHFSAASQLCQISGIVATLNRLKTNIKVFHQNWFDEACSIAQTLGVQVKVPDSVPCPRDSLLKPGGYYKDAISVPLVDHIINSVKDHFSDDHKEALNFLSLVPCSVTMSYTFESLKSKPPLYVGDLPDPDNFFTELSCWKVKWKTKVVSPTIPDTIFQTLRLPLMQYFANINTLLKIMSVLPSTTVEHCGEVNRHKMFQDYLRNTYAKDRTLCLAMLQVGTNFNRDLDRMVTQCLKVTPKTLEGICLDKEAKNLRNSEIRTEDNHNDEEMEVQLDVSTKKLPDFNELKGDGNCMSNKAETEKVPVVAPAVVTEEQETKPLDENGHPDQLEDDLQRVFMVAARLARKKRLFLDLPKEEQDLVMQELGVCHWDLKHLSDTDMVESIVKSMRETILAEVQESPFFSIIIDKAVSVDDKKYVPVFVRYVDNFTPRVELLGFLTLDSSCDADTQAKTLAKILSDEWGLQMGCCRGQSFMCMGAGGQGLRKLSLGFLESFPMAVNTPSESCGLAYWLAVSLHNDPIAKVLGVVEDLLVFFDQSPRLHVELSQTREGLLNTPREALAEVPETCLSKWKKTEDFFDLLVDMLEGALSCLDSVSNNADGSWSNSMSIHALMLSTAIRESDFVISLVILKNACAPLRNCSTVLRCGNPADIICELEKIPVIIESLVKMLENISVVHSTWFEEATQLAVKVAGALSYPDTVSSYDSPEVGYRETVGIPVLSGLIEEMKFNFSECHLKALRVLSLLPTCNPLPILPEAPDKLYTIYQSDLPEPDAAEEEMNAWAAVWREKYQDSALPTSISETLHHPEAKGHPNVTTLLRIVAVLPSISMECDLMKTTLNSLRRLIVNDYGSAGKTDAVMLLMHRPMLRTLEQVIDRCMELDAKSHGVLSPVDELLSEERVDTTSSGVSEMINGITQDQLTTTAHCDTGGVQRPYSLGIF
ncbi:52 kDa repressor of the inhibitor of the protein kinase [Clarias magur]|uniref:52 kDa repressor of the inhibitor of the protein kinase n=1 Tax=Clarias magur TaxID=1594786 RepID=A0A8J4WV51_CLAMG|nr:52 kDa repressor of the inhibitor of the protein kinase [Clarias magur]